VDRIRDGGSFTTRRVVAIQNGQAIFNMQCSFQREEQGFEHQYDAPPVAEPASLTSSLADQPGPGNDYSEAHGIEVRLLEAAADGMRRAWVRVIGELAETPLLHAAAVAFTSDLTPVGSIMRRHEDEVVRDEMHLASIDHCLWFHRPCRADAWLLHDISSPV